MSLATKPWRARNEGTDGMKKRWKALLLEEARGKLTDLTHDFSHTLRVLSLAKKIAKLEKKKFDSDSLEAACLLHDIAYARGYANHEVNSAKLAGKILARTDFPKAKIPPVLDCIRKHRFSKNHPPQTIEQKILQDADKLDALGAVGIARCFLWTGERKMGMKAALDHFPEKLLKLKERMNTKNAKKLAHARHKYMLSFLGRFSDEQRGTV